jgi:hypothetical protein
MPNPGSTSTQRRDDCLVKLSSNKNPELTCAKVYGFKGEIRIKGQAVKQQALLFPKEKLQIPESSTADLVFDTLDMAKADSGAEFYFEEGLQGKELKNKDKLEYRGLFPLDLGKILISDTLHDGLDPGNRGSDRIGSNNLLVPHASLVSFVNPTDTGTYPLLSEGQSNNSDSSVLRVVTDEMKRIDSIGAVYVVQRDKQQQRTQVFNLSNEIIGVADNKNRILPLGKYQTIAATKDGFDGEAFEFPLCSFYRENEQLLKGLRPGEEEFIKGKPRTVQLAYDMARSKTLPAYHELCQRRCPIRSVY